MARSPLRYPGGKTRAIKQIMPLVPDDITEFREPFIGGGSVFFAIKNRFGDRIKRYWINDLNRDLACFWTVARDDNKSLVDAVRDVKHDWQDGRVLYHYLRDEMALKTDFDRALRFFVMNRITFSGTVDSGGFSQGAFERRFTDSSIERLAAIGPFLQGVHITNQDYGELLTEPGEGVFVFLDPPYYSATQSRLYGSKGDLHTGFDHERFAEFMRACTHRWLITYDDSDYVRELFDFARIEEWTLQYGMNNYKQENAEKGQELFIHNVVA